MVRCLQLCEIVDKTLSFDNEFRVLKLGEFGDSLNKSKINSIVGLGKTALLKHREHCILYAYVIIKIVVCKLLKNKSQCTSIHIAIFKYYRSYKYYI